MPHYRSAASPSRRFLIMGVENFMRKSTIATIAFGATLMMVGAASAQTTTGGSGAEAKTGSAMTAKSGSPGAKPGHGQSTEHANGKMRAHKNF